MGTGGEDSAINVGEGLFIEIGFFGTGGGPRGEVCETTTGGC